MLINILQICKWNKIIAIIKSGSIIAEGVGYDFSIVDEVGGSWYVFWGEEGQNNLYCGMSGGHGHVFVFWGWK